MKKIYLDNNIIIDVKNARDPAVTAAIKFLDRKRYQIVYSPAHVEEVAATVTHHGATVQLAIDKLSFLGQLSDSTELLPYARSGLKLVERDGIYVYKEHPKRCYERVVAGLDSNNEAEKLQKQKLASAEAIEEITGVTSRETNSVDIQKEIDIAKPRIHQILVNHYNLLKEAEGLASYIPESKPDWNELNFRFTKNYFPIHEMLVEKIFDFLEMRRYYPDDLDKYINGLHDSTHAIYAAYCDIFVTNDRNLREKTKAVYRWLGIETIVLSRKEFVEYMETACAQM